VASAARVQLEQIFTKNQLNNKIFQKEVQQLIEMWTWKQRSNFDKGLER